MPKVTKTFSWASGADSFTDVGSSADLTAAYEGSDGDPSGCVKFTLATAVAAVEQWRGPAQTWEDWGVPPGATVTHVILKKLRHRRPSTTGQSGTAQARVYVLNGSDTSAVTDANGIFLITLASSVLSTWTEQAASASLRRVNDASQASNSTVKLQLYLSITGTGTVDIDYRFDEVEIDIYYDLPTVTKTWSWATTDEGFSDQGVSANITAEYVDGDGDPADCFRFWTQTSSLAGAAEQWLRSATTETWESLGVPPNCTVLGVQFMAARTKRPLVDQLTAYTLNLALVSSGGVVLTTGNLYAAAQAITQLTTWSAQATSGAVHVPLTGTGAASNTSVRLRVQATLSTGAGAADVDIRLDEIQVKIWYEPFPQDLAVAGDIASGEAFGDSTVALNAGQSVTGVGDIVSAEVFGTSQANLNVVGVGDIVAGESFGQLLVAQTVALTDGIPSAEAFGAAALFTLTEVTSTSVRAKRVDWLRHPSSTPTLVPQAQPGGGPLGGIGNALKFDLSATASLQRAAYANSRLGQLRGRGLFAVAAYFSASALRSKVAVLTRWNAARLEAPNLCYVAELVYDNNGISCLLREGPDEAGRVLAEKRLDPNYGFAAERWMEVAVVLDVDTVGSLVISLLARSNGVVIGHATLSIADPSWYVVERLSISRHLARSAGQAGWQVLSRAGAGFVQVGSFRAMANTAPSYTVLPDNIEA